MNIRRTPEYGFSAYKNPERAKELISIVQSDPRLSKNTTWDAGLELLDIGKSDYDYGYNVTGKPIAKLSRKNEYNKILSSQDNVIDLGKNGILTDRNGAIGLLEHMKKDISKKYPNFQKDYDNAIDKEVFVNSAIKRLKKEKENTSRDYMNRFNAADVDLFNAKDSKGSLRWYNVLRNIKANHNIHKKEKIRNNIASDAVKASSKYEDKIQKMKKEIYNAPKGTAYAKWVKSVENAVSDDNDLFHWRNYSEENSNMEKTAFMSYVTGELKKNMMSNWELFKKDKKISLPKTPDIMKTKNNTGLPKMDKVAGENEQPRSQMTYAQKGATVGAAAGALSGGKSMYKKFSKALKDNGFKEGVKSIDFKKGVASTFARSAVGAIAGGAAGQITKSLDRYNKNEENKHYASSFLEIMEKYAEDPSFSYIKKKIIDKLLSASSVQERYVKDISCECCGYTGRPNNIGQCPGCGAVGGIKSTDKATETRYDSKLIGVPQDGVSIFDLDWMARQNERI